MPSLDSVVQYYDTHPINEEQILAALRARGLDLDALTQEQLKDHDQDHFGGLDANDQLIDKAGIRREHRVLDLCSGMGGPARYLAHRIGCQVTGLDLTQSRLESARRLTALVRLDHLVDFRLGNALEMPFPEWSFDVIIGQEAWCHIPHKLQLLRECARVLRPGGVIAFTDILRTERISSAELERLGREMTFSDLGSMQRYRQLLEESGHELLVSEDLSALWADILLKRLAMYRSLAPTTVSKFGEARHLEWDRYYSFFVGMYTAGKLGGGRFVARKTA